ncbi:urea carboxylase-associated family protein [Rhizobium sp. YTU87027]|uniref:urea carboxylase-associated family protein n=1 Tax=Rhizobium sp. YTU87027 TaxID=3417741 RepID=UPI003D69EA52
MKPQPITSAPEDASSRKAIKPVICYPVDTLPRPDLQAYRALRHDLVFVERLIVPPRDAACWNVPAGHFCRILSSEGSQVGDLNLFNANNLEERLFTGKTRALNGTHVGLGDQLFSNMPYLRPIATITHDTLDWYGFDEFGGSVHDVIGTRCDPYTHNLLSNGGQYHHCCHSNLTRVFAAQTGKSLQEASTYIHDVLNVFMCTGFTRDTGQYFMKASPVRPGDYLEFFAEIDLLGCMSACSGGDCSSEHSSDAVACYPLAVEIYKPTHPPEGWSAPKVNGYDGTHGL